MTCLPKLPEQVGRWRGTAYVERCRAGSREEPVRQWAACGLRAGPFVLFGEPDLLDRIRRALPEGPRGKM